LRFVVLSRREEKEERKKEKEREDRDDGERETGREKVPVRMAAVSRASHCSHYSTTNARREIDDDLKPRALSAGEVGPDSGTRESRERPAYRAKRISRVYDISLYVPSSSSTCSKYFSEVE